ncbi:MAG TPA: helix-turn-helix domain-containing protein [Rubrivivax sp.]|nr:helix-turn-helix domain-containing protein [Rubrivivax sp.]
MQRTEPTSNPTAPVELVTEFTLAVFRLNGVLLHWGDELVAPLGLTSARWQMLGAIALAATPLSAPQIGQAMGVTRQGAQKQLNLLLDQGLVEARANPAHRRSPLYVLTPKGQTLYRQADALWTREALKLATLVPAAALRSAARTLESLQLALQPQLPSLEDPS